NQAHGSPKFHKRAWVKILGVHDGGIHVGEDAKIIGDADIVSVTGGAVTYDAVSDLAVRKRFDHFVFKRHLSYPTVGLYRHPGLLKKQCGGNLNRVRVAWPPGTPSLAY